MVAALALAAAAAGVAVALAADPSSSPSSAPASRAAQLDSLVAFAQFAYRNEATGPKVHKELRRMAADRVFLGALARGDLVGAHVEAENQENGYINPHAHITRVSVIAGRRVLVNAVQNRANGGFVVAPATRELRFHGRRLGTLLVSIQDVIGYVRIVHRETGVDVVVRGRHGRVRTSSAAAAHARLPASGSVTIAGRGYRVRSFPETGWGSEPLTVWLLYAV